MTKPRVKIPPTAKVGDIVEIKAIISHVMETGRRKTPDGQPIPRKIINTFSARYAGNEVFKAELHPGISANPYLAFFMRIPGPGEFEFTWVEDGGTKTVEKLKLNVT